jgi:hypothetical protein
LGDQVTLTTINPDGATISWNLGVQDGVPFQPPFRTTIYTVTAELNGCVNTANVSVTVHLLPNISASVVAVLCAGLS